MPSPGAPLTDEPFARDLESSFGSVRDTLARLYDAEWLCRLHQLLAHRQRR